MTASAGKPTEEKATAKLFMHGRSQAVRLPKEFRFEGKEVRVSKVGDKVILEPLEKEPFDVEAWRARLTPWARGTSCPRVCPTIRRSSPTTRSHSIKRTMFCLDTNIVIFALNKRRPWIAAKALK